MAWQLYYGDLEPGKFYKGDGGYGGDFYFYPTKKNKNGGYTGQTVSSSYGTKPVQKSFDKQYVKTFKETPASQLPAWASKQFKKKDVTAAALAPAPKTKPAAKTKAAAVTWQVLLFKPIKKGGTQAQTVGVFGPYVSRRAATIDAKSLLLAAGARNIKETPKGKPIFLRGVKSDGSMLAAKVEKATPDNAATAIKLNPRRRNRRK